MCLELVPSVLFNQRLYRFLSTATEFAHGFSGYWFIAATMPRSVAMAIAKYTRMINTDQSNGEMVFRISPVSFDTTFSLGFLFVLSEENTK